MRRGRWGPEEAKVAGTEAVRPLPAPSVSAVARPGHREPDTTSVCQGQRDDLRHSQTAETAVAVLITQDIRTRSVTPTTDANGVESHDPLSDVRTLFPQVGDHIGQLCGIF
jgi:hypothetical protein